ncbi:capping protein inhibiting regulator of actin dynamics [Narcine bancroftii]|uniref:capping protein inhibiting regulator of actin dynamics n=1 Tax=Narcine bancroftii TaxID=1343680 RepID=UPI003831E730
MENTRANSEVDGLSRNLLDEHTQQEIQLPGSGLKVPQARPAWPSSTLVYTGSGGTIESINLDAVPQSMGRLDNTAARHKLSVKPRNQRVSKKHGRLALEMQNVIVHEFEYELEKRVQTHVENGQKHYKTVEGKQKEEKGHKGQEQSCRDEGKKHKGQKKDETQYEFTEQKKQENEQRQEAQRIQEQGQRNQEVEEQKVQEEKQREREEAEKKVRKEELKQREEEEQKLQEEGQKRRGDDEQKLRVEELKQKEEEERQKEVEEQKLREMEQKVREEEQRQREAEQKVWEEEQRRREEEQKVREEEQRQKELEKQKVREEERRQKELEKQKVREEEQRQREEEQKVREEEQRQREEEQKVREEKQRQREVEEQNLSKQEQQCIEVKEEKIHKEEQTLYEEEKQKRKLENKYNETVEFKKENEEEKCLEPKEINENQEKEKLHYNDAESKQWNEEIQRKDLEMHKQQKLQKQHNFQNLQMEDEEKQKNGKVFNQEEQQFLEALEEDQRREELRWKDLDQRQTMSQPFSFQVASGEKQIIFPKVNLTPVTHPRETVPSYDTNVLQSSPKSSKGLSSSSYVPHTAILVTGAQLCGTAVDLKEIKDTACKSLLGISEEIKTPDLPLIESANKPSPDVRGRAGKSKFNLGQSLDQSRALTEWAAIRAKILKTSNEKLQERERRVHSRLSDDWTACKVSSLHGSLRKTLSANAKFSITPAWQKWADSNKVNDGDKVNISHEKEKQNMPYKNVPMANSTVAPSEPSSSLTSGSIVQDATEGGSHTENHNIRRPDAAEGCKFAKDLPSFLVPSLPATPRKEHSLPQAQLPLGNQAAPNETSQTEGTMDTSPFGIKLRRTHYSLRFHYEQQGEQKRKKRYSAGDSMEGIPAFLAAKEKEGESCTVSGKQSSCTKNNMNNNTLKDSLSSISDVSQPGITHLSSVDVAKHIKNKLAALSNQKLSSRPQTSQKPALAPKPSQFTAPPSPHITLNKTNFINIADHKNTKTSLDSDVRKEDEKNGTSMQTCRLKNEEETKDKKSLFPSINLPWRERAERKPDSIKKEKPILQSRHSLDSSRLVDKVESAQPLWITLAMQKQRGFREQQASREERRQAREAKMAEKLTKENVTVSSSTDVKTDNHYTNSLNKSTQDEEKKIGINIVSKLERREHLKKSATLPNSVTVEICDSLAPIPPVKELPKRFSTPDAAPVSVEPAWLALAKRKAKAWSDCPQIIK